MNYSSKFFHYFENSDAAFTASCMYCCIYFNAESDLIQILAHQGQIVLKTLKKNYFTHTLLKVSKENQQ